MSQKKNNLYKRVIRNTVAMEKDNLINDFLSHARRARFIKRFSLAWNIVKGAKGEPGHDKADLFWITTKKPDTKLSSTPPIESGVPKIRNCPACQERKTENA